MEQACKLDGCEGARVAGSSLCCRGGFGVATSNASFAVGGDTITRLFASVLKTHATCDSPGGHKEMISAMVAPNLQLR
jgi:hypothetical protein